ncbi:double-strand break repair helicase AddA [Cypionkella psychrotolerans]|uniref:double-strand break repair helicase AddA n=1 Tax=Cypionkella psychrotolerans TaxID=1678131 RepID=UPI0006B4DD2E|nr:double-strand break repair helicase AddA [Cypionkella psychrotolerans]
MTRNDASERQVQASNPADTVWLSANAGSGKTRVLTDRVARLLLRGVEPQHILCLTYTKAAATEMQNRLFRRLGEWAMKPDADLHRALADLGDDTRHAPGALAKARQLFARAIETPGGLRIQTIHSFCATLLRRFPLEAGVSPQFTELDDRAARLLRENIVEEMAEFRAPEIMAEVARAYTGEDFTALMEQVSAKRAGFTKSLTEAQSRDLFNVPNVEIPQTLLADVLLGIESDLIANILPALQNGGPTDSKTAAKLAALDLTAPSLATLGALENTLLYGGTAKAPYGAKIGALPTKPTQKLIGNHLPQLDALMLRVEAARPRRIALQAAQKTAILHRFAASFLPLYESAKSARGFLDFDDLITRAKALLTDPSVAAWVLFRLDGGIDHILVDEAQDTSPDQWRVIELLSAEFTAGQGTRDETRTLFVVGDKKQSIYSFQGADVAAFDEKQTDFQTKFRAAQKNFVRLDLEYSFRSSTAILRVVDETFADRFPKAMGSSVHHLAFKSDLPGRVDLWPLLEKSEDPKDENWEDPVDLITDTHHTARLAEQIASHIKALIDAGTQIPVDKEEDPNLSRPLHAGDVLILVQRRSALFSEIIRACKKANLPIAGADRLKLGAELAVKDLAALLSFLATPEDDLSLAALLRSPLCGWTEAELYALAQPRKGFLWETLRDTTDHPETLSMLHDLRNNADFLRPYDLIERALTRHDGRRRLLTRLGPEAEDGIDEFLSQALAFERNEVPSLTGFLIWMETDDIEVKRQMDSEGHRIRVMTVHGAKGLEAPLVILPDTCDRTPQDRDEIYAMEDGIPVWKTPSDESPPPIATARSLRKDKGEEESLRLLYVALTRARTWLIVCGAGEAKKDGAWYKLVQQGMQAAGSEPIADGALRHSFGSWPDPAPKQFLILPKSPETPLWATTLAATPERPPQPLSPSNLGGAKLLPGETDGSGEDAAKARGTALHLLLEYLPNTPRADWPALSAALIPDPGQCADLIAEAEAVLTTHPHIFAPEALAEVTFTATFNGQPMQGTIDRLLIAADHILAVDFKSNHRTPATAVETPEGILRQMAAYAEALRQIYPSHRIDTAVLWTRTATLMPLPPDIVRAAMQRSTIP